MIPNHQTNIMDGCAVMNPFTQKGFDDFDDGGKMCPILADPLPECYCIDMTSMKIPYAIKYCLFEYKDCDIYRRIQKEGDA